MIIPAPTYVATCTCAIGKKLHFPFPNNLLVLLLVECNNWIGTKGRLFRPENKSTTIKCKVDGSICITGYAKKMLKNLYQNMQIYNFYYFQIHSSSRICGGGGSGVLAYAVKIISFFLLLSYLFYLRKVTNLLKNYEIKNAKFFYIFYTLKT